MSEPAHRALVAVARLLRFARRVVAAFLRNRGILLAGGVGYNALLSMIPFLTLTMGALSAFFEEEQILEILGRELTFLVPQNTEALLQAARTFLSYQAAGSLVSVAVLLFFSSLAFRMLEEAVTGIFHGSGHRARRHFLISVALPYLFMLLLVISVFVLTVLTSLVDGLARAGVRPLGLTPALGGVGAGGVRFLLGLAGFAGLTLLFSVIYLVMPVGRISRRRAFIGGFAAALLWRGVGGLLTWWFASLSMVNLVYGSLATVVVVLLFLEAAFIVLLLGAQVIAELEASAAAGRPWYEAAPPG
jgi:YihY family inner membrane protein